MIDASATTRTAAAKALLRKSMLVARRVLGQDDYLTLRMRWNYGVVLYKDDATLGGAHPHIEGIEEDLQSARAALRARETPPGVATRTRAARARASEEEE